MISVCWIFSWLYWENTWKYLNYDKVSVFPLMLCTVNRIRGKYSLVSIPEYIIRSILKILPKLTEWYHQNRWLLTTEIFQYKLLYIIVLSQTAHVRKPKMSECDSLFCRRRFPLIFHFIVWESGYYSLSIHDFFSGEMVSWQLLYIKAFYN